MPKTDRPEVTEKRLEELRFTKLRLEDADVLTTWFQDGELRAQMG